MTTDVLKVEPLQALPKWEVGKTYWLRNHRSKAIIVSTQLNAGQPIAGIRLHGFEGDEDDVQQWSVDGHILRSGAESVLDLTNEEVI